MGIKTNDEHLENGSVVYWSRRFKDGRYPSGHVRWRVPVRCSRCGEVRDVGVSTAHGSGYAGLCPTCANAQRETTEDEELSDGSVILWSRRYRDGRTLGGRIRHRVPARCGMCGEVRGVSASAAHWSGFTGLCHACANDVRTDDEHLENGSAVYWSRRFKDGRIPSGDIRWRVPVRCGACGQVRDVSICVTYYSGFTGLCHACAGNEKIHIPKATLEDLYHDEELSTIEIGDYLGCDATTVLKKMEEYGIERRPSAYAPQTLVPEAVLRRWSTELAYVVGMVTADGNLARGCNAVKFFSTDHQWIEVYLKLLRIDAPVHEMPLESGKTLYTVAFSDPDYRAFLERVGLTPAKSTERTLGPLDVPDVCFRDFLRACIDGDGSIGAYPQKHCSTLRLQATLYSACPSFLKWVEETVKRLIDLEASGLYGRLDGTWTLKYGDSKARQLLEWTYHAPDLPCLERKRAIWEAYQAERPIAGH